MIHGNDVACVRAVSYGRRFAVARGIDVRGVVESSRFAIMRFRTSVSAVCDLSPCPPSRCG